MLGICSNCKEPCEVVIMDSGIGLNEYWGFIDNDIQLSALSTCCEAPGYIDNPNKFITISMIRETQNNF